MELDWEERDHALELLKQQLASVDTDLRARNDIIHNLKAEVESSVAKKEEAVLYLQLQLSKAREAEELREREAVIAKRDLDAAISRAAILKLQLEEKDCIVTSNREIIQSLHVRVKEFEQIVEKSNIRIKELEKNMAAAIVLKAEQEALLASVRKDLKATIEAKEDSARFSVEIIQLKERNDILSQKLSVALEQLTSVQASVDEKNSLVTRLRSEALVNERNHAMRTAVLATCEAQIEALKQELFVKDATNKEAIERVSVLQERLAGSEIRLEERMKEMAIQLSVVEEQLRREQQQRISELADIKEKHDGAVDTIKRDFAKKSVTARAMLSEKEDDIRSLQTKVTEMQAEITSGAPSERRIFELAQVQAKRDAAYGIHRFVVLVLNSFVKLASI